MPNKQTIKKFVRDHTTELAFVFGVVSTAAGTLIGAAIYNSLHPTIDLDVWKAEYAEGFTEGFVKAVKEHIESGK